MTPELIAALIEDGPTIAEDIMALFKKHPALTPDGLALVAPVVFNTNAATRTAIAADLKTA